MAQKVVAHFIDHAIVKGTSMDVDPGKSRFHVRTEDNQTKEVDLDQLKALYFVKDFSGKPNYTEAQEAKAGDSRLRGSHQVRLTFLDGEQLSGLMNRYPPNRPFFFVLPIDPASNNLRILVNREAVTGMQPVESAEPSTGTAQETKTPKAQTIRSRRTSWVFDGKEIRYVDVERRL
jgi:hypothetical protein